MGSSSEWNNEIDDVRVNTCKNPWHNPAIIFFPLWSYDRRGNDGDMTEHPPIAKFNFHFFTPLGIIFSIKIFGYLWVFLLIFGFISIFWFLCWKRRIICSTSANENITFPSDFFWLVLFDWFCFDLFFFCLDQFWSIMIKDKIPIEFFRLEKPYSRWYHIENHNAEFSLGLVWWILDLYYFISERNTSIYTWLRLKIRKQNINLNLNNRKQNNLNILNIKKDLNFLKHNILKYYFYFILLPIFQRKV